MFLFVSAGEKQPEQKNARNPRNFTFEVVMATLQIFGIIRIFKSQSRISSLKSRTLGLRFFDEVSVSKFYLGFEV